MLRTKDAVIPSGARDLGRVRSDRYWVYILASPSRVLYTGSTSNLLRRIYQHKHGLCPGFTRRYSVTRLVYYDWTPNVAAAVARERQIKGWAREKKILLIEATNAGWEDLAEDWFRTCAGKIPRFARDDTLSPSR